MVSGAARLCAASNLGTNARVMLTTAPLGSVLPTSLSPPSETQPGTVESDVNSLSGLCSNCLPVLAKNTPKASLELFLLRYSFFSLLVFFFHLYISADNRTVSRADWFTTQKILFSWSLCADTKS